ncbi:MAG: FecR family protein, partial [Gallionella sp.]|nr:FecR family protein [Gallionella sp.]
MELTAFGYNNTQRLVAGYFILMRNVVKAMVFVSMASASNSALAANGYFSDVTGQVSVVVGKNAPRIVEKNATIASGAVVRTGDASHAELKFEDGQVVSMRANTTFQIREYRYVSKRAGSEKNSIVFSMLKGGMRFVTGQIGQRNPQAFRLITPHATIRVRGTDFMCAIANSVTYCKVLSGSISITNAAGTIIINAGQTAMLTSASTLATVITDASVPAGVFDHIATISLPAPVSTP